MRRPNFYAAGGLDRVGPLRKNPDWIKARLTSETSRFVPVWRAQHLVRDTGSGPEPILLDLETVTPFILAGVEPMLLGLDGDIAHFALDLSAEETPLERLGFGAAASDSGPRFQDLRAFGPLLTQQTGSLLAYARGLAHWHNRHRFCGVCGSATIGAEGGHVRICISPDCKTHHFPRTDPAVIMLVTDGDRMLLGRQAVWMKGMYSTLAGFVEPGESLEEAVAREVKEEAGVEVEDVVYHSSQPWPFPSSIMLGFYATAKSRDIHLNDRELEDARWFSRDWVLDHEDDEFFRLPRKDSISRRLIEDWLAQGR
ncbi:NADH pyrophosphatase [Aliidongia dinghuensis]|uniref:NAD(+) diphosphatase n=1 Tax=Aliidongia dinghuensis TaxID=1867774 RepID=A0A8J2YR80_9PROT|nr:NAD(+) diphosphatase [Aliidongia dinghuensis]GGF08671.1 NADH pyrophosphatase [Aliidongia dinghuensis]